MNGFATARSDARYTGSPPARDVFPASSRRQRARADMRLYRLLSDLTWLSYPGKILMVIFIGIHVPLITAVIGSLLYRAADTGTVLAVLGVLLVATLVGTGATLYIIYQLLQPMLVTSRALDAYRETRKMPALPTLYTDAAGQLMRDVQCTVQELDGLVVRLTHFDPESGLKNLIDQQIAAGEHIAVVALRVENRSEVEAFFDIDTSNAMLRQFTDRLNQELSILACGRVAPGVFKFSIRWKGLAETERELIGISDRMSAPLSMGHHVFYPRLVTGVARLSDELTEADTLMAAAMSATTGVTALGETNIFFYSPETEQKARQRFHMDQELREAIGSNQFELHYQPIVDFARKKVVTAEALVRWRHPKRGLIPPDQFIPVAEAAGLIVPLGAWILKDACRQAASWSEALVDVPRVAINISARQFRDPDLLATIDAAVEDAGIGYDRLKLEITETVLFNDNHLAKRTISEIQSRGVTVGLDDFGAEYSNLRYIANFEFDEMKIDRLFVDHVDQDDRLKAICKSILTLSEGLGIPIVAEGVERPQELRVLHDLGCTMFQGYYFSRPVPASEFPATLRRIVVDLADLGLISA